MTRHARQTSATKFPAKLFLPTLLRHPAFLSTSACRSMSERRASQDHGSFLKPWECYFRRNVMMRSKIFLGPAFSFRKLYCTFRRSMRFRTQVTRVSSGSIDLHNNRASFHLYSFVALVSV